MTCPPSRLKKFKEKLIGRKINVWIESIDLRMLHVWALHDALFTGCDDIYVWRHCGCCKPLLLWQEALSVAGRERTTLGRYQALLLRRRPVVRLISMGVGEWWMQHFFIAVRHFVSNVYVIAALHKATHAYTKSQISGPSRVIKTCQWRDCCKRRKSQPQATSKIIGYLTLILIRFITSKEVLLNIMYLHRWEDFS